MKCPICKKSVEPDGQFAPFCGDRCRVIDLGNWAMEKYVVTSPLDPSDVREDTLENE